MTIQLTKSELLHTIKFGVGKKLLETRKVSIFDRKFEILLEGVEPSDRTELIKEFFGRKVDYSNPDKMISDWQSSKAGQKFIKIFNEISPESDFNSNNLFNDKAAWNALRLANDVTDGKYDVEDAKDFQKIFLQRQGGDSKRQGDDPKIWEPSGFGGRKFSLAELSELIKGGKISDDISVKVTNGSAQSLRPLNMFPEWKNFIDSVKSGKPSGTEREGRRIRSRDLQTEPEAPPPLKGLPPEIAKFLREIRFRDHFEQLTEEMLNKYTKQLGPEKRIDFQDIIEEHFDTIFGNFLTLNEEFTAEEIRDVIREALNDARTQKIPLKGTPNQIYRPMEIGQRPVDPSGHTRNGKHELGGKFDNISIDNEKEIANQKFAPRKGQEPLVIGDRPSVDPLKRNNPNDISGNDIVADYKPAAWSGSSEAPTEVEQVAPPQEEKEEYFPDHSDQTNIPKDFEDAIGNYLILPILEVLSEAQTEQDIQNATKNELLDSFIPGAKIVKNSLKEPELVIHSRQSVNKFLKDKVLFLDRDGNLYRALPQSLVHGSPFAKRTIQLNGPLLKNEKNTLKTYFGELLRKGNINQNKLRQKFISNYGNTIEYNKSVKAAEEANPTPPGAQPNVVGGVASAETEIGTPNPVHPANAVTNKLPGGSSPGKTLPDLRAVNTPSDNGSSAAAPAATPTAPPQESEEEEFNRIGKTQVDVPLTPAEQKLPIQIIGEMSKNIFEYLVKGLEHVESPKRKAEITKWIQDTFERAVQAIPKTKANVAVANANTKTQAQTGTQTGAVQPRSASATSATSVNAPTTTSTTPPNTPTTVNPPSAIVAPATASTTPTTSQSASAATPINPPTGTPVQSTNPQPVQASPISTVSPLTAAKPVAKVRNKKSVAPSSTTPASVAPPASSSPTSVAPPVEQATADPNAVVDPNIANPAKPEAKPEKTPTGHAPQIRGWILKYALGGKDTSTMQAIFKEVIDGLKTSNLKPTVEELVNGRMAAASAINKAMQSTGVDKKELKNYGLKADEVVREGGTLTESGSLARPKGLEKDIATSLINIAFARLDKLSLEMGKKSQLVKGGFLEELKAFSNNLIDDSTFGYSIDASRVPAITQAARAALGIDQPTTEPKVQTKPVEPAVPIAPNPAKASKNPKSSKKVVTPAASAPTENPAQVSGKQDISSWANVDPSKPEAVKGWKGQKNNLPVGRDPIEAPSVNPEQEPTAGPEAKAAPETEDFDNSIAEIKQFREELERERKKKNAERAADKATREVAEKAAAAQSVVAANVRPGVRKRAGNPATPPAAVAASASPIATNTPNTQKEQPLFSASEMSSTIESVKETLFNAKQRGRKSSPEDITEDVKASLEKKQIKFRISSSKNEILLPQKNDFLMFPIPNGDLSLLDYYNQELLSDESAELYSAKGELSEFVVANTIKPAVVQIDATGNVTKVFSKMEVVAVPVPKTRKAI